jgi:microcystin-dependent protein
MSKVVITGNASGTGDFTIAAPNSNTNRTLTLPDEAGTILTKAGFVGEVTAMAASSVPTNWLECDGAAVNRTTYAALFAVISTIYGVGDGSTTFNLPDLRGEFIRGWDNGKGTDSGRGIASSQTDDFKAHTHTLGSRLTGAAGVEPLRAATASGAFTEKTTSSTGGTETRPRNIAMMFVIKY